ncbi:MAG: sigma-54-dependent transcriptional regulator [Kiritimatiellia bacterium]
MKHKILIVDDEKDTREYMARALGADYLVVMAADAESALRQLEAHPDIVLMLSDVRMPGIDGMQLLRAAKAAHPRLVCILLTAFGNVDQAVAAMQDGADDFIMKPVDLDILDQRVAKALRTVSLESEVVSLRSQLDEKYGLETMVGSSDAMQKVFSLIKRAAPTQATVLIQGANGTGKELVAHALHRLSPRASGPFIAVNCGAIPENLIESELFGHERGAFTGAVAQHVGSFEAADHGTIFLDEIGDLPLPMQVKLLRALENRSFQRVGGTETIKVDIRIVAATNKDLKAAIAEGRFREDLYYRLNVVDIHLPALKDRRGDIPLLVMKFIKELAAANGSPVTGVTPAAMRLLENYAWPGNVRELRNAVEKMIVLATGPQLDVADVPEQMQGAAGTAVTLEASGTLGETEKAKILAVLRDNGGNRSEAARVLGISRRTLYRKLDKYAEEGIAP